MFKKILLLVLGFILIAIAASAEVRTLQYHSHKDGEPINNFFVDIHEQRKNQQKIFITVQENGEVFQDELWIDGSGDTIEWISSGLNDAGQHTRYTAQRMDNIIFFEGQWRGSPINKKLKIDDNPLFYNPKFSLTPFVNSKANKIEFWGLRQDTLTVFKMIAKKQGEEVVEVGGKPIKTMRVHWTVKGLGSMFFKRTYWFRMSDGLYVKQLTSEGGIRELVGEHVPDDWK